MACVCRRTSEINRLLYVGKKQLLIEVGLARRSRAKSFGEAVNMRGI